MMILRMEVRTQLNLGTRLMTVLGASLAIFTASLSAGCAASSDAATRELDRLRSRVVELEGARQRDSERLEDLSTRLVAIEARPAKRRPDLPIVRVRASSNESSPNEEVDDEEEYDEESEADDGPRPVLKLHESSTRLSHSGTPGSPTPRRSRSIELASVNERLPVVPLPNLPGTAPLDMTPAALSIDRGEATAAPSEVQAAPAIEEIVTRARSQIRSGSCAAALESLAQVLSRSPEHPLAPEAMMLRAQCYRRQGAPLRAIGELERLARRYPSSGRRIDALLEMAEAFISLGDAERAREIYREIMRRYPRSRAASRATARIQELGRGQRAREE